MKKKLLSGFCAITMILSLAACGSTDTVSTTVSETVSVETEKTTVSISESVTETASVSEEPIGAGTDEIPVLWYQGDVELYYSVIKDFCYMMELNIEPLNNELSQPAGEVPYLSTEDKDGIGVWFTDLDGDGVDEMLIGRENLVYAICGLSDNEPFVYLGAAYRSAMTVYENGLIVWEGSSGVDNYSYRHYKIQDGNLVLQDLYYTAWDPESEGLLYYHNTTGDEDDDPDDVVAEEEYNLMIEVGLEAMDYSDDWISFDEAVPGIINVSRSVTADQLCEAGVTWSLAETEDTAGISYAKNGEWIQTLNFREDGTASFYREDGKETVAVDDITIEYSNDDTYNTYLYVKMPDTTYQMIQIVGFTNDGLLLTQRSYYDYLTGDSFVVNEYYERTMG